MALQLRRPTASQIVTGIAACLLLLYGVALWSRFGAQYGWLIDETGLPRNNEYVGVRAAGELVLQGRPAAAYDWDQSVAQQSIITGRPVTKPFPWPYPPTYLIVAAGLASLPLVAGALLWIATTMLGFAWVASRIVGVRAAGLWAAASPVTLINAFVAHTGFLTAGLLGFGLHMLPVRPVVAGAAFGLLTVKPQLGVLVPIALIAGGYWRTIASAAITAALLALLSLALFGIAPWIAMVPQLAHVTHLLRIADVNMDLVVTLYGALRSFGISDLVASTAQGIAGLLLGAGVFVLWRSAAPDALKAAGLVAASVLVSPYMFIYDLMTISIAVAFLIRHTGLDGLERVEASVIGFAVVMLLLVPFVSMPWGFLASMHVGAVILRRAWPFMAIEWSLLRPGVFGVNAG